MSDGSENPFPYGYQAASESVGSVASPLLAGFSFALVGLVIPSPEHLRWPNAALLMLVAAGTAFISAVQCSFWARQYAITPEDIKLWDPDFGPVKTQAFQRLHNLGFYKWNRRTNDSYRAGILLLLLGIMLALVPPHHLDWWRGFSIAVAALAVAGELFWVGATWLLRGSPVMVFNDEPDVAPPNSRFGWLRTRKSLRRAARFFVPLPHLRLTDEERQAGKAETASKPSHPAV